MKTKKIYKLKDVRLKEGVTLRALSAATGVPVSTIWVLENGKGEGFSAVTKHVLADFFHVPFLSMWPEEFEKVKEILGGSFQMQMFFREEPRKD